MRAKRFLRMTGTLFALVALAHLVRLVMGWSVVVGGQAIPMWVSIVALIGASVLSWLGLRLSRRAGP